MEQEELIQEDIEILNHELMPKLHRKYRNALTEIIEEVNKNTCVYEQTDIDWSAWTCSNCKCDWCLEDGTPKDNNLNYCPECGARIKDFIEYNTEEE